MRLLPIAAALGMALAVSTAQAATISYSDTVPSQQTNFNDSFDVPLFNSSFGTLTSIKFTLSGTVTGSIRLENFGSAQTVGSTLSATLTLYRPGPATMIVVTTPLANVTDNFTTFDGTIDFGGTSGKFYPNVSQSDSDSAVLTSLSDRTLFTGIGNIILPVNAAALSFASGGGNTISQFNTNADATLTIEYTYTPAIPEPLSLSLLGAGLLGLGLVRVRRKA
jgi:hypothetical protein